MFVYISRTSMFLGDSQPALRFKLGFLAYTSFLDSMLLSHSAAGKGPPSGKAWQHTGKDPPSSSSGGQQPSKWQALPEWASEDASGGGVGSFDASGNFTSPPSKVSKLAVLHDFKRNTSFTAL